MADFCFIGGTNFSLMNGGNTFCEFYFCVCDLLCEIYENNLAKISTYTDIYLLKIGKRIKKYILQGYDLL